ncbi:MAG: sulfotransferase domain-containing protein [Candidatus Thorarchaeota archaeon]
MNYIVSGLERSGTSLMMQILEAGGVPVAYDASSRPADLHNPRGYYELDGGKIIRRLMDGNFDPSEYDGVFIKVTAYGIKWLPESMYRIVYMLRDIEEVLDSTERMVGRVDREKEKHLLDKLNRFTLQLMDERDDIKYVTVSYNDLVIDPVPCIRLVSDLIEHDIDVGKAASVIDLSLYRNRHAVKVGK